MGQTAEYGFRLASPSAVVEALARSLLHEATPVGVTALEVALREVRSPTRVDGTYPHPLHAGLQWMIDIHKDSFIGKAALIEATATATHRPIGAVADAHVEAGTPIFEGDEIIGEALSSVYSPGRDAWIINALVKAHLAVPGETWTAGEGEAATVTTSVSSPYIVPRSWYEPVA